MRQWIIGMLCVFALLAPAWAAKPVSKSVVQVSVEGIQVDQRYPWQIETAVGGSGSGFIVDTPKGLFVLTAAHVVAQSTNISLRKAAGKRRFHADVAYIGDESDLALLSVSDPEFFKGTKPLPLGDLPKMGDRVDVWGFPEGGTQLAFTQGVVSRIDFDMYSHSKHYNLVVQVDAAINSGASGGPAMVNGAAVGVSFQTYDGPENVGYIVPAPVIRQFFTDIADGEVDGVPEVALFWETLLNAQKRRYYGMRDDESGVLVVELSAFEKARGLFREGDVILSVDGVDVADDGTVESADGSARIDYGYLVSRKQVGDHVNYRVRNGGTVRDIDYVLSERMEDAFVVTRPTAFAEPDYRVIGGVVVRELTVDFINTEYADGGLPFWLDQWVWEMRQESTSEPQRKLIISAVIPHSVNESYGDLEDLIVAEVNGVPVHSLRQFDALASQGNSPFLRIRMEPWGEMVFDRAALEKADAALRERFAY